MTAIYTDPDFLKVLAEINQICPYSLEATTTSASFTADYTNCEENGAFESLALPNQELLFLFLIFPLPAPWCTIWDRSLPPLISLQLNSALVHHARARKKRRWRKRTRKRLRTILKKRSSGIWMDWVLQDNLIAQLRLALTPPPMPLSRVTGFLEGEESLERWNGVLLD